MSYPPSAFKTWTSGEILTASDLNSTVTTINNSNIPEDIDDFSVNTAEMRTQTDPFPAGSPSLSTALSEEIARLRYQVHQILNALYPSKTYWYEDVVSAVGKKGSDIASGAALTIPTDGNFFDVTGTTSVTSMSTIGVGSVIYLQFDSSLILTHHSTDLVLPNGQNIRTKTGDVATFIEYASGDWMLINFSRPKSDPMAGYRRPVLKYASATAVDVENNTGTANQTSILFPDGDFRSVTEDTGSTHKYRRFDITADAEFTSGTEDSGLRAALSEATNTWYAIYAVKSAINTANFVLVGDTTLPLQANFSTLNTAYGTNGWVYLGLIRNGDNASATGDIIKFVQHGNITTFSNSAAGNGGTGIGTLLADSASTATLTYTYAAGTGTSNIPDNVLIVGYQVCGATAPGTVCAVEDQVATNRAIFRLHAVTGLTLHAFSIPFMEATQGIQLRTTNATAKSIYLTGFVDSVLGVGGNPIL